MVDILHTSHFEAGAIEVKPEQKHVSGFLIITTALIFTRYTMYLQYEEWRTIIDYQLNIFVQVLKN